MGDQAVVATGVLNRDGDDFATQYEIRRFKIGKSVFCAWCGPQSGDPPPGHYDLADGTLRCRFDPADYETPADSFVSFDVVPLEGDRTEMFQFTRQGFHIEARESYWNYQVGSLFHLVLPPGYLPLPEIEFIEPKPTYGWRFNDRFAIGWQGSLFCGCTFRFRRVAPEVFEQQAGQLRHKIKSLSQGGSMDRSSNVKIDHVQQKTVLFLSADPTDASRLRLGEELREIQEKLQLAKLRDQFVLEQRMSVRPSDISQALLDVQPQIVHFSGHGTPDGALCFENQMGQSHLIQADALAALFEQFADQVKCVVLNACYSEMQANAIAKHIEYVIGTYKAIGDKAAIAFSIGFYQALGAGRTIEDAFKLGVVQIRLQGIAEHLKPVLKKR